MSATDDKNASSPNAYWFCAETNEELRELLEMFWEFHDFRVEQIDYNASEDRIDLHLEDDAHKYRVLLRFIEGAYMNFIPGYCYLADWLKGASLGLGERGRIVWSANEDVNLCDPPSDLLWISANVLNYTMVDGNGRPMAIPESIVHHKNRVYDFKLGKNVESFKDFHPRHLRT